MTRFYRICFVLTIIFSFCIQLNAKEKIRVQSVVIRFERLVYSSYASTKGDITYDRDGGVLKYTTGHPLDVYPPKSLSDKNIKLLLYVINECSQKDRIFPFTRSDITNCVSFLESQSPSDSIDVSYFTSLYKISKEEYLNVLRTKDVSEYSNLLANVSLRQSPFSITIVFNNGDAITLKPSSIFEGDGWIVNNGSYVKDELVMPILDKLNLSDLNSHLSKSEMLLEIIGQYYGSKKKVQSLCGK